VKEGQQPRKGKARILVIDDHPIFSEGLTDRINQEPDLTVCSSVTNCREAPDAVRNHRPDCVTVDVSLPDGNGIDLVRDLHAQFPSLPVLVLSMHDESLYAERAISAGAHGYIMKRETPAELIKALHQVLDGDTYLSEKMTGNVLSRLGRATREKKEMGVGTLTSRESEIYRMIGTGAGTSEIASALRLSVKTIATHRENIKRKLNVQSATELVRHAVHSAQG
jgi:DNA-binding NarL/FixJ family response regulator